MPRGGKRKGAGRPARTDGRRSQFIRFAVTDEERNFITENTTPDERREALIAYLATKNLVLKL